MDVRDVSESVVTWEGIVGVEEVDLLSSISIHIAGRHSDSVSLRVSQGVIWRTAVVYGNVYQFVLGTVILQNQVWAVVPKNVFFQLFKVSFAF